MDETFIYKLKMKFLQVGKLKLQKIQKISG